MSVHPTIRCVLDIAAESGETPVWSVGEQRLYWVDQLAFKLNRFDPVSGKNEAWSFPAHISSFALRGPGRKVLVALRTGLFDFDPATGTFEAASVPPPYDVSTHRYNDGRCDRQGRYWVGTVDLSFMDTRIAGRAAVYRFDARGLKPMIDDITCANGMAFSPDGRVMYLADTTQATVFAFDFDPVSGTPSNRRVFVKFDRREALPDGAEVDAEGGYWVALLMANAVARYRPDGSLDRRIPVPVLQPTKICFGGSDLATLYLTSAAHRHIPGEQALGEQAGGVFAINDLGVKGLAEPSFSD